MNKLHMGDERGMVPSSPRFTEMPPITSALYFPMSPAEKAWSPKRNKSCFCWENSVLCYLRRWVAQADPGRVASAATPPPRCWPQSTIYKKEAHHKTLNQELQDSQWVSNNLLFLDLLYMQKVASKYSHEFVLLFANWVCWVNRCCQSWLISRNKRPKNNHRNSFPPESQENKAISSESSRTQLTFLGHL